MSDRKPRRWLATPVAGDPEAELLANSTAVRILGAVALLIGGWLAYETIYVPLRQALAGAPQVTFYSGMVGVAVAALICGVIMVVAGKHALRVLVHRWHGASPLSIFCTLLLVAFAFAAELYFEHLLAALMAAR